MKAIEKVLAANERKVVEWLTTRGPPRCGENEPDMVVRLLALFFGLSSGHLHRMIDVLKNGISLNKFNFASDRSEMSSLG
jgi:hypothetical protein